MFENRSRLSQGHRRPQWTLAAIVAAALLLIGLPGAAAEPTTSLVVQRALERVKAAHGASVYTELRGLWETWQTEDPQEVEAGLRWAEDNASLTAPTRAYARLLEAFARRRRGDLRGARATLDELGYVPTWTLVGPFDNEGKAGFNKEFEPEMNMGAAPLAGRAFEGKERPVRWRPAITSTDTGWLDVGTFVRPTQNVCVFAATYLTAKAENQLDRVSLWVGAAGAHRVYWNGQAVLTEEAYRGHDVDRRAVGVRFLPGTNVLMVKACGDDTAPVVSVRVADWGGGAAAPVDFHSDLESAAAGARTIAGAQGQTLVLSGGPEGPLQTFERLNRHGTPTPQLASDFAEYLQKTHGDDESQHQARDLAVRAAEQSPTVRRALLASKLVDDRNQRLRFVQKASDLATPGSPEEVDALLATADTLLDSPRWREALPLYQRAFDLDPSRLQTIDGLARMYREAGMPRTAMALIDDALTRLGPSVALLDLQASQLAALKRTVEAHEAEERYLARRFDDRSLLRQRAELATERHDEQGAEHWLSRLQAISPTSLSGQQLAASSWRQLGQPERAITSLEKARALSPEDVGTLRQLSDLYGQLGRKDTQLALLEQILTLRPQDKGVREYLEYLRPQAERLDEKYATSSADFLKLRNAPSDGFPQRVLRDLTVTSVFGNGLSSTFRQLVFQPLTDSAAALARQYSFAYQADRQIVQLRGARVYRADGRVDEAVESGEGAADSPEISMYTSARTFYIQFPRLEPGDVVELRYRIEDVGNRNELADYFGDVVYMQSTVPVKNAEYVLITPRQRKVYVDARVPGLERTEALEGDSRIQRFRAAALAPLLPEPSMPPEGEVASFIHVTTYDSWKSLGTWYWGLIRDQFALDAETRALAHRLGDPAPTTREKVAAVYDWVIRNTRYVALEFGIYGFKPRPCVQTVARGWGDCKDTATVLVALLGELGIEATPVIVRTQMRGGFSSSLPSLAIFDHAIAYVPALDLYLDGTAQLSGIDELPLGDRETMALQVLRGDSRLVTLPTIDPARDHISRTLTAKLRADGSAQLELDYTASGAFAPGWRGRYQAEATRRDRLTQDLSRELPGLVLDSDAGGVVATGLTDYQHPVRVKMRASAPKFATAEGGQLRIDAVELEPLTPRYCSLTERKQDLRLLEVPGRDQRIELQLPPGVTVSSLPIPTKVDSPFGSYELSVEQTGTRVRLEATLSFKTTRISPKDYPSFRQFCAEVDRVFAQKVVVKR